MTPELVSIITPCYNGEKYLAETIESVIAQTYLKWEMIIIDDGSKDNSVGIIKQYMQIENRIHLICQKNAGSAAARNLGIQHADGQYIALLDADDLWNKTFLEKQIKFMKERNAVCVYCSYKRINEHSKEILRPTMAHKRITDKDMLRRNYIGCLSGLYDISKYGKVYLHEELKSIRDDYAYWIDIVKLEGKAYGNPEILASYRVLQNSTTGRKTKLVKKQYKFYRNYLKLTVIQSLINTFYWGVAGFMNFLYFSWR